MGEHLGHILGRRGGQLHRGGKPGQLQQSAFGQHRGDDFHLHFTDAARDTDLDIGLVARVCQLVTLREVVSEPLDGRGRGFGEGSRRYFGVDPVGDHRRGTVYRHARGVALVGADGEDQFPVVLVGQHVEERLAQIGRGCRAVLVGDGDALRVDRHGAAGGRRALGDQRGVDRGDVVCARREFEGQLLGSDRFFGRQHNRSHLFRRCAALHAQCEDRRETVEVESEGFALGRHARGGVRVQDRIGRQQVVFAVVPVTLLRTERAERNGHRGLRSGDARRTVVRVECAVVPFAGLGGQRALERAGFRVEGELPEGGEVLAAGRLVDDPEDVHLVPRA